MQTAHIPGLRVDLLHRPAGPLEFNALSEHRVLIHAGASVSGTCHDTRFVYSHGDIDVLPAGTSDACHQDDASSALVLRLAPALLRRAAQDMGLDPERTGLEQRYQLRDSRIEHIAWALDAERRDGELGGRLYAEGLGLALSAHLLRRFRTERAPRRARGGLAKPQLQRVLEYIDAHIDRDLSLVRLAEVAGVSASHLKQAFRVSIGLPVHEYVIRRRVERAKALLLAGRLPASQIALDAGFAHQSHMARCMRRVLGVTPRALVR